MSGLCVARATVPSPGGARPVRFSSSTPLTGQVSAKCRVTVIQVWPIRDYGPRYWRRWRDGDGDGECRGVGGSRGTVVALDPAIENALLASCFVRLRPARGRRAVLLAGSGPFVVPVRTKGLVPRLEPHRALELDIDLRFSAASSTLTVEYSRTTGTAGSAGAAGSGGPPVETRHENLPEDDLRLFETNGHGHWWNQYLESLTACAEGPPRRQPAPCR